MARFEPTHQIVMTDSERATRSLPIPAAFTLVRLTLCCIPPASNAQGLVLITANLLIARSAMIYDGRIVSSTSPSRAWRSSRQPPAASTMCMAPSAVETAAAVHRESSQLLYSTEHAIDELVNWLYCYTDPKL